VVAFGAPGALETEGSAMRRIGISMLLLLVFIGVASRASVAAETPAEKAANAILEADRAMAGAVEAKDKERFLSFVARDAVFLGGGLARGRDEVGRAWAPFLAADRTTTLRWDPLEAHVSASADLGYTFGRFTLETIEGGTTTETMTKETMTKETKTKETKTGHYVTVWQKQPDGSWQAVADAGSPPQPAPL
jgi:ketosteroid isomerase-like protein